MTERVERWCRGLASLALLVGLVVGVPAALLVLGGNPLPPRWDLAALWRALLQPDDGTVLARLLTLTGWLAWLVFTASLLVELVNLGRHRSRGVVLPGLGGVQQWAAGLMLAVVALGGAAQVAAGPAEPTSVAAPPADADADGYGYGYGSAPGPAPEVEREVEPAGPAAVARPLAHPDPPPAVPLPGPSGTAEHVHVVRAGDDLWSLAEHYYGRGWTGAGSRRRTPTGSPVAPTG